MRRFYSPEAGDSAEIITLDKIQSGHLFSVLRLNKNDRISVFDGKGHEFECEIVHPSRTATRLAVVGLIPPPASESPLGLSLAVSLLKNDKFDFVVQKAVELGVKVLQPVWSTRSEVPLKSSEKRVPRWEKIAVEASKQCGRATLMSISKPAAFTGIVGSSGGTEVLFAESGGGDLSTVEKANSLTAYVGPEGGWTDEELDAAARAGVALVTLGARILRAETAAVTAAALIQHRFGDLR